MLKVKSTQNINNLSKLFIFSCFILFDHIILYLSLPFQGDAFPENVAMMKGLRWLRLNKTNLNAIPVELRDLEKLVVDLLL